MSGRCREASQAHAALELGFRQDSGDGESGTGIELGGGAGYVNRASGLSVTGRVRTLLSDGSQVEEWGLSGSLVVDARPGSEMGFAMSLEPAWGVARHGTAQALWSGESAGLAGTGSVPGGRLDLDTGLWIRGTGREVCGDTARGRCAAVVGPGFPPRIPAEETAGRDHGGGSVGAPSRA